MVTSMLNYIKSSTTTSSIKLTTSLRKPSRNMRFAPTQNDNDQLNIIQSLASVSPHSTFLLVSMLTSQKLTPLAKWARKHFPECYAEYKAAIDKSYNGFIKDSPTLAQSRGNTIFTVDPNTGMTIVWVVLGGRKAMEVRVVQSFAAIRERSSGEMLDMLIVPQCDGLAWGHVRTHMYRLAAQLNTTLVVGIGSTDGYLR